jgi:hypothetical protein
LLTGSTALRFTATGTPLSARRIRILPMPDADNLELREVINFVDSLMALCFTASNAVHA